MKSTKYVDSINQLLGGKCKLLCIVFIALMLYQNYHCIRSFSLDCFSKKTL